MRYLFSLNDKKVNKFIFFLLFLFVYFYKKSLLFFFPHTLPTNSTKGKGKGKNRSKSSFIPLYFTSPLAIAAKQLIFFVLSWRPPLAKSMSSSFSIFFLNYHQVSFFDILNISQFYNPIIIWFSLSGFS